MDAALARPHADLGYIKMGREWDFAGGESEFKKALELDPNDAQARAWYAENIGLIGGREQEALAEINRAHQLDPQSAIITHDLGTNLIYARQYDAAIAVCKKQAGENPTFAMAHYCLTNAYWGKRMYSQAIEEWKLYGQLSGDRNESERASAMEQGFRSAGWNGALRKGIEVSLAQRKTGSSSAYGIAQLYAELGEKDQAFHWLNTAFQEHDDSLVALKTDSSFDPIRSDPRFAELVRKVGLPQASGRGTQNPEAYALYLKGRSYFDKQTLSDLKTAVSYFNQAIAKDPGYALAYSGLANVYAFLPDYGDSPVEDHPKAMALARKALELDPTLSEPHLVLGGQMMFQDWDLAGGVAEFKKAVELDPNNAHVHDGYAFNISIVGGMEQEALAEINRAHQLDPQSQDISYDLGLIHIHARRFDEAIAVCKKLANENPRYADAHSCLADAYWRKRMYSQSLEEYKAECQLSGDRNESERASAMEQGFRSAGWQGALSKSIETVKAQRKTQPSSAYGSAYSIAAAYAELGDKDQAFQWLNTAYQEHDEGLMGLKTDDYLDPLRSDPRFAELVRKVGLQQ
ncbi:MAG: tetratricopeptide repeat protein [Candidatus Sulfotelmatobacter sp.]